MRFVAICAFLGACGQPEGRTDFDELSDGGIVGDFLPAGVDGNWLPLDGGTLGEVWFTIVDRDTKKPIPSRIIFRPPPAAGFADSITSGTYQVMSPGSLTGAIVSPGVVGSPEGVMLQAGIGKIPLPPGTYTVFITRGPEYEALESQFTIGAGEVRAFSAELDRSVDTAGWLAADLHVHTGRSFDAQLALDRRVISLVSNGIEVIVPTDHNKTTDAAAILTLLGYDADTAGNVPGDEFNFLEGHAGAYPMAYNEFSPTGGAPDWIADCQSPTPTGINCFTAATAFPMLKSQVPNTTVVTVNHPWWPTADLGYFTNIGWGVGTANPPPAPLSTAGLFEGLEVLNGYWARPDAEEALVTNWFFLLSQGHRVTALGSSDTHRTSWVRSGWPRSWLRIALKPGEVTGAVLAEAIKKQRAIASTGPFIVLTVDGAQIGDTIVPQGGQVSVDITVDAPAWMAVKRVKLYVNGVEKRSFDIPAGTQRPVFHTAFTETIVNDSTIVAFASGDDPLPPDVVGELSHVSGWEMLPWAITNPVFVDANNDGMVRPMSWKPSPLSWGGARVRAFRPRQQTLRTFKFPQEEQGVSVECEPNSTKTPLPEPIQQLMPLLY